MAKWYGKIGYAKTVETSPGIWEEVITEKSYYGEVIRNTRRLQSTDKSNSDVNVSNEISILSDPFTNANFHAIRYITFMGTEWRVSSVDVQYPRLILSIGDIYNGERGTNNG